MNASIHVKIARSILDYHVLPLYLFAYSIVADTKEMYMSILAESPASVIPSGTWSVDPVWSALELEVKKLGLVTVKGRALGFSGKIEGGRDARDSRHRRRVDRSRRSTRPVTGTFSHRTSSTPRGIRSSASSPTSVEPGRRRAHRRRRAHDQGRHEAGRAQRGGRRSRSPTRGETSDRPRAREARRPHASSELNWNAPLPGGGFLLPNEVVLKATFAAVKAA